MFVFNLPFYHPSPLWLIILHMFVTLVMLDIMDLILHTQLDKICIYHVWKYGHFCVLPFLIYRPSVTPYFFLRHPVLSFVKSSSALQYDNDDILLYYVWCLILPWSGDKYLYSYKINDYQKVFPMRKGIN